MAQFTIIVIRNKVGYLSVRERVLALTVLAMSVSLLPVVVTLCPQTSIDRAPSWQFSINSSVKLILKSFRKKITCTKIQNYMKAFAQDTPEKQNLSILHLSENSPVYQKYLCFIIFFLQASASYKCRFALPSPFCAGIWPSLCHL